MPAANNPSQPIAEFVLGELDHFKENFRPQGGALTSHGQEQLMHEPFVGYARVADRHAAETRSKRQTQFNFPRIAHCLGSIAV